MHDQSAIEAGVQSMTKRPRTVLAIVTILAVYVGLVMAVRAIGGIGADKHPTIFWIVVISAWSVSLAYIPVAGAIVIGFWREHKGESFSSLTDNDTAVLAAIGLIGVWILTLFS